MTTAQLGGTGIVLGDVDARGVRWRVEGDLWGPSPRPRAVVGERVMGSGSWDATEFFESRRWALAGTVEAPSHEELHRARVRLEGALGASVVQIRGVEPAFDRIGWYRRDSDVEWAELTHRPGYALARYSVSLFAPDPRLYAASEQTVSMGFPATSGGLEWPATWPATWNATVVSGEAVLDNDGTCTAWPTWRIDGPVTEPSIINAATGEAMHFDLALAAGEWLVVNTETHEVLANGDPDASRRDKFWGTWWGLAPGVTPVVARFGGSAGATGAALTAYYRDVWI